MRRLAFVAALATTTVAAVVITMELRTVADWTATGSNRLTPPTLEILGAMTGPVTVVVSAREHGFARTHATNLLAAYRRAKDDLEFRLIDPQRLPARAARLGLERVNQARIEHEGRVEHTDVLTEAGITNALYRVSQPDRRWIAVLTGHGERRLHGPGNHDLGVFGRELEVRGIRVRDLNLAEVGAVPENSAALVIASPSAGFLEGERELLAEYLAQGGNLLWLVEPAEETADPSADALAALLDVHALPGVLVAPAQPGLGRLSPAIAVITRYPAHPITDGLRHITLFPVARALAMPDGDRGFSAEPLLLSSDRSWTETGDLSGSVAFDTATEVPGPLALAIALERPDPTDAGRRAQRVVVLGDADFLSNRYVANQGNLQLGLQIIDWLTAHEDAVAIPTPALPDAALGLTGGALQALALFASLGLPASLLATGFVVWWRRRRR
jgi:hypothetical protein